MLGFSLFDIFLTLLAAYFLIRGCMRGFVGEIVSLLGFLCSFFFSFKYSSTVGKILEANTALNRYVAQILAVLVIWLCISLLSMLVRAMLKKALSAMNLGGLNTLLGALSGVFKFTIVVYSLIIAGLLLAPVVNPTWLTQSNIIRYAGRHWQPIRGFIVQHKLLANAGQLPNGTLEQALRPYRTGTKAPR